MHGGQTVATDVEARAVKAAIRAHPEVWGELGMDAEPQVRAGDELCLEPCVDPVRHRQVHGRDCPYVELWGENAVAARLVFATLPEHTRPLMSLYAEAVTADMTDEDRDAAIVRTVRALQSRAVDDWRAAQWRRSVKEEA